MSSIHHSAPSRETFPKTSTPPPVWLAESDRRKIRTRLAQCETGTQPFLAHVLRHKIETAQICTDDAACGTVIGGSRVAYAIDDGPAETGLLSHRARISAGSGVILVGSLLGATLIGMRAGQRAPLLREDGSIGSVRVLKTVYPG